MGVFDNPIRASASDFLGQLGKGRVRCGVASTVVDDQ
jgi:hypothetical protein